MEMEGPSNFKIVLLGEGAVGKSSIMLRFIENKFNAKHMSTVQAAFASKRIQCDGQDIELQIWDTAGQEKFHALSPMYYRNSNGAMLVYDITDAQSFQRVKHWNNELRQILGHSVCIIIVGNKVDLELSRTVEMETAESYASSVGVPYRETSAKENLGIDEVFEELTRAMLEKFPPNETNGMSPSSRRSVRFVPDEPVRRNNCCRKG